MTPTLALVVALAKATPEPKAKATASTHAERRLAELAPADQYFGPLKMSAIAIRTRIDALGRRYLARTESDADLLHDAANIEVSMNAWRERYPNDTWLAPTAFHLGELYQEIQTPVARARARATFRFVGETYAKTPQGHLARLRLVQGFPPLHDESPVVATPVPVTPSASSSPPVVPVSGTTPAAPVPGASPTPGASPPASPGASPQPSPGASAKPSPIASP